MQAGGALVPISDEALADWLHDTVGECWVGFMLYQSIVVFKIA